jgi:hypothetical protein
LGAAAKSWNWTRQYMLCKVSWHESS